MNQFEGMDGYKLTAFGLSELDLEDCQYPDNLTYNKRISDNLMDVSVCFLCFKVTHREIIRAMQIIFDRNGRLLRTTPPQSGQLKNKLLIFQVDNGRIVHLYVELFNQVEQVNSANSLKE